MNTPVSALMNTYARLPIAPVRGQGVWLWDAQGKPYLDALSGIAVNTLGHNHPQLVPALQAQIACLMHTSNYYQSPLQEELAAKLTALAGMGEGSRAFFCSSGLEANEAALKLVRKWGHDRGIANPQVIVYEKAFHGRSLATLWASGNEKIQKGFEPAVPGFVRVPQNDLAAVEAAAQSNPDVVAVLLESIQGEGGIRPLHKQYLQNLRALCTQRNWLLVTDEVQCGMGRTGRWFAHQWAGIVPDVMTLAKGLGSGVPIGALLAGPQAANTFGPGNHGSTFGGNPLAMRAGLETIAILEKDGLLAHAAEVGAQLKADLEKELGHLPGVVEVRGQGLMLGIELDRPCAVLAEQCAQAGLLVSVTADKVIRLLPPLIVSAAEAKQIVERLCPVVKGFLQDNP